MVFYEDCKKEVADLEPARYWEQKNQRVDSDSFKHKIDEHIKSYKKRIQELFGSEANKILADLFSLPVEQSVNTSSKPAPPPLVEKKPHEIATPIEIQKELIQPAQDEPEKISISSDEAVGKSVIDKQAT